MAGEGPPRLKLPRTRGDGRRSAGWLVGRAGPERSPRLQSVRRDSRQLHASSAERGDADAIARQQYIQGFTCPIGWGWGTAKGKVTQGNGVWGAPGRCRDRMHNGSEVIDGHDRMVMLGLITSAASDPRNVGTGHD
jgi:hypothetical protein